MRMRPCLRTVQAVGILIIGGLTSRATAQVQVVPPQTVYAPGSQVVRYYANPNPAYPTYPPGRAGWMAPAQYGRTVGPNVEDWTTGRRLGMHKPWLRSR
jgi:hypothetical protein